MGTERSRTALFRLTRKASTHDGSTGREAGSLRREADKELDIPREKFMRSFLFTPLLVLA